MVRVLQLRERLSDDFELALHGRTQHGVALILRKISPGHEICQRCCGMLCVLQIFGYLKPHTAPDVAH